MSGGGESRFPPTMRLKRQRDFRQVYRDGRVWKGSPFTLHVLVQDGEKRLGIVIPRRWGNAVQRNRMKRVLREAFRRNAARISDVAIIAKPAPAARSASIDDLGEALVAAVEEIVGRREVSR